MREMSNGQSTRLLLGDCDREQCRSNIVTEKSGGQGSPQFKQSKCDFVLSSTRFERSLALGSPKTNCSFDRLAYFVLFGWGAGLLVFTKYAWIMRGGVFQQEPWENYQVVVQTMSMVSTFLAFLVVIREVYQLVRLPGAEWKTISELDASSTKSLTGSWLGPLKIAIAITIALGVGIPGEHGLLQVLTPHPETTHSNITIEYTYLSEVDMGSRYALCCNGLFAEYTRLLLSQGEYLHSSSDFYGNVKIPDLARLKDYTEDDKDWTSIPLDDKIIYASLLGVPLSRVPSTGNTTFTIEASYYSNKRWPKRWEDLRSNNPSEVVEVEPQPLLIQSTFYGSSIRYVREHQSPYWRNTTVSAYCTIKTHYVSVNITCTPSFCSATSMRPSRMPHPNINMTDFGHIRAFYEFTRVLMIAGRDGHATLNGDITDGNTLTEYFLQDPYFGSKRDSWGNTTPYYNHSLSTAREFAERIQMVLNGFKMLHMGGTTVRNWPNLENTKLTTGHNVAEESVMVVGIWKMTFVALLGVSLVIFAVVEIATSRH
ncbi:hypothetical protein G7Y89_g8608 [Cudoniella acicularis]|uniref:Uncharacterized protein n=1 Tax=Cudoniella acicularis TaxID=354080 RepID=A0A8H4RID9_9HELO|nr:hypothetical protein G7Y89_g8608 [Cudoniella acicularis]